MRTRLLVLLMLFGLIQGCAPVSIETQIAVEPTQNAPTLPPQPQFPQVSPTDWIITHPFLEAPYVAAEMVLSNLPEGFNPQVPEYQVILLPSGLEVQATQIEYQYPMAGQVYIENSVTAIVIAYQNEEARSEHFDQLLMEGYNWEFQQLSNHIVARYYDDSMDGRIWVSGPYFIVVYSGLDTSEKAPWVETFADLYLKLYPSD